MVVQLSISRQSQPAFSNFSLPPSSSPSPTSLRNFYVMSHLLFCAELKNLFKQSKNVTLETLEIERRGFSIKAILESNFFEKMLTDNL